VCIDWRPLLLLSVVVVVVCQTPHQQTDKFDLRKNPNLISGGGGFGPVSRQHSTVSIARNVTCYDVTISTVRFGLFGFLSLFLTMLALRI